MPTDTTPEAAAAHLHVLRRASTEQRLRAGMGYSRSMIALSRAALRERCPDLTSEELAVTWVGEQYGVALARAVRAHLKELRCRRATNSSTCKHWA